MIGKTINERYQIQSELGQGGMGTVYRGFDATLKRDIAVKILTKTGLGMEGRTRLLHEAQSIAKLNHPNIVTVHDAGEVDSVPFIVMEHIDGTNLKEQPPKDFEEIIDVARQVCNALEHAHKNGIIHRDLKPGNIIITPNRTAKLMDFGLARSSESHLTREGVILGTVSYMAPEQVLGQGIDPRADLYALGVMLYELSTGELPFQGDDPVAVISQHLHAPLVTPRVKNPEVPPGLDDLIVRLMKKDPEDRPVSAAEVHQLLEMPNILDMDAPVGVELTLLDRIVRGQIIGRENELESARNLWEKAQSSDGQSLLVSGEPGIGKTRLMREVVAQAEVSGGQALIGTCYPEGNGPYEAFGQIIRQAFRRNKELQGDFPTFVMAELLVLAPNLKINFPDVPENPPLEGQAQEQRLLESVVTLCRAISTRSPLLLVVEDLHWADGGTLSLFRHLARRTRRQQIMMLGTYREVELDQTKPFVQVLLDMNREKLATRLKLDRLNRDQTREMLFTMFTEEITPEFLEGIYFETDGNPFFIEEVSKALLESGKLYFDGEQWDRPDIEDLEIPQSVRVAIQSRVNKLPPQVLDILTLSAILGREFDFDTLKEACKHDEDIIIDALESAERAQLIEEVSSEWGGTFTFSHALIHGTLESGMSGLQKRRLHRTAAEVLERLRPDDFDMLAYQYTHADIEDKAIIYLRKAGKHAQQTYANQDAIQYFTQALEILPEDDPQRYDVLAVRAQVYKTINQYDNQKRDAESMLAIAEGQNDIEKKMDALLELATYSNVTDTQRINEYADQVVAIAKPAGDKGRLGQAYFLLGQQNYTNNSMKASREYFEKALDLLKESGLMKQAAENLSFLSLALGYMDKEAAVLAAQEALVLSKQSGDKLLEAIATRRVAVSQMRNFQYEDAYETVQIAIEIFHEMGDQSEELHAINVRGILHNNLENFKESEQDYLSVLRISDEIGDEPGLRLGINNILELYSFYTGEYEKGLKLVETWIEKCRQVSRQIIILDYSFSLMFQFYILGQYRKALEICKENLPAGDEAFGLVLQLLRRFFLARLHFLLGEEDKGNQIFKSAYNDFAGNEFDPRDIYFFWFQVVRISQLQPGIFPNHEILEGVETCVSFFRENKDSLTLINALYSISEIHLEMAEQDSVHLENALAALDEAEKLKKTVRVEILLIEQQLFTHARAHYLAGQDDEGDRYLKQAYEWMMACADKITTPEYRTSYLENVPWNREIVREAKKRGLVLE